MEGQLVAGGHMSGTPMIITYANEDSSKIVWMTSTTAVLNGLKVKEGNILNATIQASATEKVWIILCPEFYNDASKNTLIAIALCGIKSDDFTFGSHLASFMHNIGYTFCKFFG